MRKFLILLAILGALVIVAPMQAGAAKPAAAESALTVDSWEVNARCDGATLVAYNVVIVYHEKHHKPVTSSVLVGTYDELVSYLDAFGIVLTPEQQAVYQNPCA